ncbi:hypothetical protein FisN_5Lh312 [Fistulifera solaris]|uniref:Ubiquitin carboxyl-terminal hydrolase n=1 Tax=Fistulifera solaris TaxID=1519565 RepID=A0A1Z5KG49_FISSO|nr:hypothetical protein FisN_5Lh312 [Fistulifera solaris]|eukprot:GAX25229.1 hypothetical protein FisN_5Lh312 [Fistulifera solaris]
MAQQRPKYGVRGGRQESVLYPPPRFSMAGDDQQDYHETTHYPSHYHCGESVASANTSTSVFTLPKHLEESIHKPKGLLNVGNTCYANAVLQCLLSTALTHALVDPAASKIFRRYSSNPTLLEEETKSITSDDGDARDDTSSRRRKRHDRALRDKCRWLTRELKAITVEFHQEKRGAFTSSSSSDWMNMLSSIRVWGSNPVVNPGAITKHPDRLSPCLRPYQQEDAHEFLRALLSTLVMNGQNRKLSSLFDGLLESTVTCQGCQCPSNTRDRYMDLSLDIDQPHVKTLTDALKDFTSSEILDGDNQVYCSPCGFKRPAKKALRLATAPSILVCHLKRFALDEYGRLIRVNKHIHFAERLQIGSYMSKVNKSKPPPYELVALLVHQGTSCDSGHYIAFCKHAGEWFQCNDSVVDRVDIKTVLAQQAYILVYEVAEMRENHGYASPHSCRKVSAPTAFSSLLCGLDDTFLGDICCYGFSPNKNVASTAASSRKKTPIIARDDSTLDESTVATATSSLLGLRRTSSSNNVQTESGTRKQYSRHSSSYNLSDRAATTKQWTSEPFQTRKGLRSQSARLQRYDTIDIVP